MTPVALSNTPAIEPAAAAVNLLPMLDPFTMGYKDEADCSTPVGTGWSSTEAGR